MSIAVYSGQVPMGIVGTPCKAKDMTGRELHVGDIVMLWQGRYIGTDCEVWLPCGGLTVMVDDAYNGDDRGIFPMGIKTAWENGCAEWKVILVKKGADVVPGEHWPDFGFSYRALEGERT